MEDNIYIRIGRKIRQENKLALIDLSDKTGVSKSLLPKMENGRTISSLPVLLQIIKSLNYNVQVFSEGITEENPYAFESKYKLEEKGLAQRFSYLSILGKCVCDVAFQSFVLKSETGAKRKKVETDGFMFLYMIDGERDYILDKEVVTFKSGDSLFFDGEILHVPQNNSNKTAILLVIYLLTSLSKE